MNGRQDTMIGGDGRQAALIFSCLESLLPFSPSDGEPLWGYSLIGIRNEILDGFRLPEGYRIRLRGYELILDNPAKAYIRFGQGRYWVGDNMVPARSQEQVIEMLLFTITEAVPAALEGRPELSEDEVREFRKFIRLKAIDRMSRQMMQTNNSEYGNKHRRKGTPGHPGEHAGNPQHNAVRQTRYR